MSLCLWDMSGSNKQSTRGKTGRIGYRAMTSDNHAVKRHRLAVVGLIEFGLSSPHRLGHLVCGFRWFPPVGRWAAFGPVWLSLVPNARHPHFTPSSSATSAAVNAAGAFIPRARWDRKLLYWSSQASITTRASVRVLNVSPLRSSSRMDPLKRST